MQELQSLPTQFHVQRGHACEVATRSIEACSEADLNWIGASDENNGNRGCRSFGRCRRLAVRDNHGHPTTNQIGRQRRQTIISPLRPAIFDRHVPALDPPRFFQTLMECDQKLRVLAGRPGVEEPDHRHRRLLRACYARPRDRRAAE